MCTPVSYLISSAHHLSCFCIKITIRPNGGVAEQEQEQLTGVEILWKFFDSLSERGLKMAGCPIFRLSQLHNLLAQ